MSDSDGPWEAFFFDDATARYRGLAELARRIFLDRNAAGMNNRGMPKQDRSKIKAEMRPHLRLAIGHVRKSRAALRAGDLMLQECERDRARMEVAFARLALFQPYANKLGARYVDLADLSPSVGKAKAEQDEERRNLAELDRLIEAAIAKREPYRVKEWAADLGIGKSTVYLRIPAKMTGVSG